VLFCACSLFRACNGGGACGGKTAFVAELIQISLVVLPLCGAAAIGCAKGSNIFQLIDVHLDAKFCSTGFNQLFSRGLLI
jgi:hypothetical protein